MRLLLTLALASVSACSFYQPELTDCVLACGADAGACPSSMGCIGGLCRAAGRTDACECIAGKTRPCGTNVGTCKEGFEECSREGTWGACTGSIGPVEETCDGRDNDCDGRTDFTEARLLVEDREPYTTYETRLYGSAAGYALLYPATMPDAGYGVVVQRYDGKLSPLGQPTVLRDHTWNRGYSAANDSMLVNMVNTGDRIEVYGLPLEPGAAAFKLFDLPDSGYVQRGQVAITGSGVARVSWATDTNVRLLDVPLDGGAATLKDLPRHGDAGTVIDYVQSTRGSYSLFQLDTNPDGGTYRNILETNDTEQVVRDDVFGYEYPFRRGRSQVQERDGQLPYVSDWIDDVGSTRVTFTYDLLTSDNSDDVLPPGVGRWGETSVLMLPNKDLLLAISDLKSQALVLASIHGTSFADLETVLRSLPENSGFGPPQVAISSDELVGLAWVTSRGIWARRVCVPRIGD